VCSLGLLLEVCNAGAHGLLDLRLPLSRRHAAAGGGVVVGAHKVPVLGAAAVAGPVAPRGSPAPATDAVFSLGAEETRQQLLVPGDLEGLAVTLGRAGPDD